MDDPDGAMRAASSAVKISMRFLKVSRPELISELAPSLLVSRLLEKQGHLVEVAWLINDQEFRDEHIELLEVLGCGMPVVLEKMLQVGLKPLEPSKPKSNQCFGPHHS